MAKGFTKSFGNKPKTVVATFTLIFNTDKGMFGNETFLTKNLEQH